MEVRFFEPYEVEDHLFKFAVILARSGGKWVLCRHRDRTTWENPGGHREPGETMEETGNCMKRRAPSPIRCLRCVHILSVTMGCFMQRILLPLKKNFTAR